jgi:hypothetical protein
VQIVALRLVLAGSLDMLDRMDQVAVRNHGMMGRFFKFSGRVVLGSAALVLRRMLQKFGGFQVMINALLRHVIRITNGGRLQRAAEAESAPGGNSVTRPMIELLRK